jgi:hypothetical protein
MHHIMYNIFGFRFESFILSSRSTLRSDELEVRQCLEYACGNVEGNIVGRSE